MSSTKNNCLHHIFTLALLCWCPNFGHAQSTIEDSIAFEIDQINEDTARISWGLKKARRTPLAIAAIYVEKGIEIATQIGDQKAMAELLTEEAIIYNRGGNLSMGLKSFEQVDSLSQILQDTHKLAAVRTNIGLTHYYLGNLDLALSNYQEAYLLHKYLDQPIALSRLLNNLAIANKQAENYTLAQTFYLESLKIKQALQDSNGMATTLMNLGLLLAEQDQFNQAMDTLELSRDLFQSINNHEDAMGCQLSLSKVMMDAGQLERAQPLVQESYSFFKQNYPERRERILAAGDLAHLYAVQNNWSAAEAFANEAVVLSREAGMNEFLKNILKTKAKIDYGLNKYKSGLEALNESYALNDSLKSQGKTELIEEMQARFDLDLKENEIELLNTKNELSELALNTTRNRVKWLAGIGAILMLFAVFLFSLYSRIRKQKQVIDQALEEKEALMKEIHHRVKNNLQVISSLLSMQSFQIQDEQALQAVRESQNRVKSMSLIHQKLYQDEHFTELDSKTYFEHLTKSLFESYNIDPQRIKLQANIESHSLDVDVMIPLGLILNELITNALKYAFSGLDNGLITVDFTQHQNKLLLGVKDDGIGLPENFDIQNPPSMGYQLISDFTRKLKGELVILAEDGTSATISIPYEKQMI